MGLQLRSTQKNGRLRPRSAGPREKQKASGDSYGGWGSHHSVGVLG